MTSLSPDTWKRIQVKAQRFLHMSSRQLVDILLLFLERPQIPPHVIERTVDPLRAELHRREVAGWDDPFHPIHDPVTP
jgi:hypothetical protein